MKDDIHLLFHQMGEVLSSVRGLYGTIDIRHAQAEQLYVLVRSDLTVLRHDQRELEEKLDRIFWLAQQDIEKLRLRNAEDDRSVDELILSVNALKQPIAEMATLKARVAGLLLAIGTIGSAALWLAEPAYRWLVESSFVRR